MSVSVTFLFVMSCAPEARSRTLLGQLWPSDNDDAVVLFLFSCRANSVNVILKMNCHITDGCERQGN